MVLLFQQAEAQCPNGVRRFAHPDRMVMTEAEVKQAEALLDSIYVDDNPIPLNMGEVRRQLMFPNCAKDASMTSKIVIKLWVSTDGVPDAYLVKRGQDNCFCETSLQAAASIRFTPAHRAGKPVACWITIPFHFPK